MKKIFFTFLMAILLSPSLSINADLIFSTSINLEREDYEGERDETFISGTIGDHFYDILVRGLDRLNFPEMIPGHEYTLRLLDSEGNLYYELYATYTYGIEYDDMNQCYHYTDTGTLLFDGQEIAIRNIAANRPFEDDEEFTGEELQFMMVYYSCCFSSEWIHVPANQFTIEVYD